MILIPLLSLGPDRLIRPGVGIGAARIGRSNDWNWHRFPGKVAGDGSTWAGEHAFAGRKTLVLCGPLVKGHAVTLISTDSARFRLSNGLHVGSSAHRMRTAFPAARPAEAYNDSVSGHHVRWDDVRRGLDWWTASGRVVTIGVHRAGRPVDSRDTYLSTIAP